MGKIEQSGYLFMGTLESWQKVEQRPSDEESGTSKCRAIKIKVLDRHNEKKARRWGSCKRSLSFLYVRDQVKIKVPP